MDNSDFLNKLMSGQEDYKSEQQGSSKRRRFVPGLIIRGRLMPYEHDGKMRFVETFHHHYFESARGNGWVFLACPKNNNEWDNPCDFCDPMSTHYKEHGSDRIYNAYKRKRKYKVNFHVTEVEVMENYKVSDTDVGLWKEVIGQTIVVDLPFAVKEKIDAGLDNKELGLSIFNPLDGYDLLIKITTKKTDDGDQYSYNLTEFSRVKTAIPGDIKEILSQSADLVAQIGILKKADTPRIRDAAIAEGLVAGSVPPPSSSNQSTTRNESSIPPAMSSEPTPPSEQQKETSPEGDVSGGSLQDLFAKYRK